MKSLKKIGLSILTTYLILAVYFSSTRGLDIPWNGNSDTIALLAALIIGSIFYIFEDKLYVKIAAPIIYILINAFPAFMFSIIYICVVHGQCL